MRSAIHFQVMQQKLTDVNLNVGKKKSFQAVRQYMVARRKIADIYYLSTKSDMKDILGIDL